MNLVRPPTSAVPDPVVPATPEVGRFAVPSPDERQAVEARLARWQAAGVGARIWKKDPTVWFDAIRPEIVDRLGWLGLPEAISGRLEELRGFADETREAGTQNVVLLGMGGSSLAPEVLGRTFGAAKGFPTLSVLDSTHPGAVREVEGAIDPNTTLFLVSSKSGTTTETLTLFRYFWERVAATTSAPGRRFVAITDPGTPLEALARTRGFRTTFAAAPDLGGRYSALSVFGMVPAALIGIDLDRLLASARAMASACGPERSADRHPGLQLGALLGELGRRGRDKVTIWTSPELSAFPIWVEQLIAESTGKDGRGLVPIASEAFRPPEFYGSDRVVVDLALAGDRSRESALEALERHGVPTVRLRWDDRFALGGEFFRWEFAIACAGVALGIHPFDQPDVEFAKVLARQALAAPPPTSTNPPAASPGSSPEFAELVDVRHPGEYIGLQAYLAPSDDLDRALDRLRRAVGDRLTVPTTLGYGPRFLHSTGQLHKGGPPTGAFVQLVDAAIPDLPVPGSEFTFGTLIHAQVRGDATALRQRGRTVVTLAAPGAAVEFVDEVAAWVEARPRG
ncbi:MAG: glucose-6-phosphate isomerase [Thermoplasmata archaeon]|nr:glucose-6-phosphate isomerase [Thermoplasmata archaeon]